MSSSQEELLRLYETPQVSSLVPQVATAAPLYPAEGMIRYAKSPWNPLGTGEAWVNFIDGSWTLFNSGSVPSHSHAIADVTGLQTALDAKAATSHSHTASTITDFSEAVDDRLAALLVAGSNINLSYNDAGNALTVSLNNSPSVSGGLSDSKGNVRDLPANNRGAAYTAAIGDTGRVISISAGGVTIPSAVFSEGQAVSIYNRSNSSQTITQGSGLTMYQAGTTNTGNRTLAPRGFATIWFEAGNICVVSGNIT